MLFNRITQVILPRSIFGASLSLAFTRMSLVSSSSVGWRSIPWSVAWDVTGIVDRKPRAGPHSPSFLYLLNVYLSFTSLSLSICILLFLSAQFSNFKYCTQNVSYNNRAVMLLSVSVSYIQQHVCHFHNSSFPLYCVLC